MSNTNSSELCRRACRRAWRNVWRSCLSRCGTSLEILLDSSTGEIDFSPGPFSCCCVSFHQWAHLEGSQNSRTLLDPKHCQPPNAFEKGISCSKIKKFYPSSRLFMSLWKSSFLMPSHSNPTPMSLPSSSKNSGCQSGLTFNHTENYFYSNLNLFGKKYNPAVLSCPTQFSSYYYALIYMRRRCCRF